MKSFIFALILGSFTATAAPNTQAASTLYDFTVNDNSSIPTSLSKYQGQVVMVVNTASKCGFTPQYKDLQKIYDQYHAEGFEILAFPSNDFGGQEPGTAKEIKKFCELNYKIKFPLFEKNPVSGKNKQPLYAWLISQDAPHQGKEIAWNFEKFLISKKGKVIGRFLSNDNPSSDQVKKAVEAALKD